jgi:hypothetical protein
MLCGSREWRSIATPKRLAGSLGTLAAELEQAFEEHADEGAVLPLVAEIMVLATELSFDFREELFCSAVEKEVNRREEVAGLSGLHAPERVLVSAMPAATSLMHSSVASTRTPI